MSTITKVLNSPLAGHLRPIDVRRDLGAIADLVELCFKDTLDPEGRSYLDQMRESARHFHFFGMVPAASETPVSPVAGYVWEEDGRIVGNLSLIPINTHGVRSHLIANVAVHPQYRNRGIARSLTAAALDYSRRRNAYSVWLQVRQDNPSALHIYQSLGFIERARRVTWTNLRYFEPLAEPVGYEIQPRKPQIWSLQRGWLERLYPDELNWHMQIDWKALRPGLLASAYRFFSFNFPQHWVVRRQQQELGVLTWHHTTMYFDPLWLAIPPEVDEGAVQMLLLHARRQIPSRWRLSLNLPVGIATAGIQAAGFTSQHTLIWMSVDNHSANLY